MKVLKEAFVLFSQFPIMVAVSEWLISTFKER